MSDIGNAIRTAREQAGFTQRQLAEKANISRTYLSDVENGRSTPSWKSLQQICGVIDIDLNAISRSSLIND